MTSLILPHFLTIPMLTKAIQKEMEAFNLTKSQLDTLHEKYAALLKEKQLLQKRIEKVSRILNEWEAGDALLSLWKITYPPTKPTPEIAAIQKAYDGVIADKNTLSALESDETFLAFQATFLHAGLSAINARIEELYALKSSLQSKLDKE